MKFSFGKMELEPAHFIFASLILSGSQKQFCRKVDCSFAEVFPPQLPPPSLAYSLIRMGNYFRLGGETISKNFKPFNSLVEKKTTSP